MVRKVWIQISDDGELQAEEMFGFSSSGNAGNEQFRDAEFLRDVGRNNSI
jgi:hypothetical protein